MTFLGVNSCRSTETSCAYDLSLQYFLKEFSRFETGATFI